MNPKINSNWGKFINDTLKNPNGVWSLKRCIAVVILFCDMILGGWIVISDYILIREINRYAIDVFNGLLLFVMALLGLTEIGKKFANRMGSSNQNDSYNSYGSYGNNNNDDCEEDTPKPDRGDG